MGEWALKTVFVLTNINISLLAPCNESSTLSEVITFVICHTPRLVFSKVKLASYGPMLSILPKDLLDLFRGEVQS